MNQNLTEIAYVLDRSCSMQRLSSAAIESFNGFLAEQQKAPGEARLSLNLFDHEYIPFHQSQPIEAIPPLDRATYVPRGSTALLDALGRTINELGQRLSHTPEAERPGQVIVAIFTDGLENSSRQFTIQEINRLITQQRDFYSWQFLFLAANQDAIATAAEMGIATNLAVTVENSLRGQTAGIRAASRQIAESREIAQDFGVGPAMSSMKACMLQDIYDDEM